LRRRPAAAKHRAQAGAAAGGDERRGDPVLRVFPFDFNFSGGAGQIARRFDSTLMQQATAGDSFENILFFMPFGFALGAVLRRRWLAYWVGTALAAMVVSAALSTLVEFGQAFLSMRDPSLTDIVNNSIGGLIGFGVYRLVGDVLLRAVARAIEVAEQKMGALMLAVVGALYSAVVCIVPIFLGADAARLGTWNPNYHLAIGMSSAANAAPGMERLENCTWRRRRRIAINWRRCSKVPIRPRSSGIS
jgi:VanZ family protein